MKQGCKFLGINVAILFTASVLSPSQTPSEASQVPNVRVEVRTDKADYALGEPIYITATLRNVGSSVAYIAKEFVESGGGIAGFSVRVIQLAGKRGTDRCGIMSRDKFSFNDPRTPKQILQ